MSAWVLALGLSAGYLVHKRFQFAEKLDEVIKNRWLGRGADPAGSGADPSPHPGRVGLTWPT